MSEIHTRGVRAQAHRQSVRISDTDLISFLVEHLGTKLVAFLVGKDASTVSRWKSGGSLRDEAGKALRVTYEVFVMLQTEESHHTVRAWFMGMNPQLDDQSPAEALRDGQYREVLAAARAFLAGG